MSLVSVIVGAQHGVVFEGEVRYLKITLYAFLVAEKPVFVLLHMPRLGDPPLSLFDTNLASGVCQYTNDLDLLFGDMFDFKDATWMECHQGKEADGTSDTFEMISFDVIETPVGEWINQKYGDAQRRAVTRAEAEAAIGEDWPRAKMQRA